MLQINNKNKSLTKLNKLTQKGAHSPDVRGVSTGVFPIQSVKSQVIESENVSHVYIEKKIN